jgi:hypothetical protein
MLLWKGGPLVIPEHGARRPQSNEGDCVLAIFAPRMANTRRAAHAHGTLDLLKNKMAFSARAAGTIPVLNTVWRPSRYKAVGSSHSDAILFPYSIFRL